MYLLRRLSAVLLRGMADMGWGVLCLLLAAYLCLAYLGLVAVGEPALVDSPTTFLYYMVVTVSTVGYGDYAPASDGGKWFVMLFIIPMGVGLFATLLGKASASVIAQFTRRLYGEHAVMQDNHVVIVGYNAHTESLVRQLREDVPEGRMVALCVDERAPRKNPFLGQGVEYFRAASLSDETLYERASVSGAALVVVDVEDDSETNLVCMHLAAIVADSCLITAYVKNPMVGRLLETHCPKVNVIPSLHRQMLVKAATDPGSEEVIRQLVDAHQVQTQYVTRLIALEAPLAVARVSERLRAHCRATLIAVKRGGDVHPVLNPDGKTLLQTGDEIYYIAEQRISEEGVTRYLA